MIYNPLPKLAFCFLPFGRRTRESALSKVHWTSPPSLPTTLESKPRAKVVAHEKSPGEMVTNQALSDYHCKSGRLGVDSQLLQPNLQDSQVWTGLIRPNITRIIIPLKRANPFPRVQGRQKLRDF